MALALALDLITYVQGNLASRTTCFNGGRRGICTPVQREQIAPLALGRNVEKLVHQSNMHIPVSQLFGRMWA